MRKYFTHIICLLICLGIGTAAEAQDPRFSQFYAAPMHVNPAFTGVFEGSWRVGMNYRDQWSSVLDEPYRTVGASYDMRLNVVGNDYFNFGFNFISDQAGVSYLKQTQGHLALSYAKQLTGGYNSTQQFLIAGGQAGFGQHQSESPNVWFSDQFDIPTETLNTGVESAENINMMTDPYFNVNVGLMWYALMDDNFSLYAGGALHHINAPDIALVDGNSFDLPKRWTAQVGGEIPLNNELSILPAIAIIGQNQGSSNSYTFGANLRYSNHDWRELAVRIGAWLHLSNKLENSLHSDAFIIY